MWGSLVHTFASSDAQARRFGAHELENCYPIRVNPVDTSASSDAQARWFSAHELEKKYSVRANPVDTFASSAAQARWFSVHELSSQAPGQPGSKFQDIDFW